MPKPVVSISVLNVALKPRASTRRLCAGSITLPPSGARAGGSAARFPARANVSSP
ncbi:conserved hypothetical protein [Ricinus communis]|uniref:Uncharacterized protein n=1 Tax=Ricinus communis TaxID=3988 RepID=B9TAM7_RICCO|nr:conserved hypothetical protein [Ricinus communis]